MGLAVLAVSCRREYKKPDVENLAGEGAKSLTSFLVVHKTSATTFDLCDRDGVGLIDGGVVGLAQVSRNVFVASYMPVSKLPEDLDKVDPTEVRSAIIAVDSTGKTTTAGVQLLPIGVTNFSVGGKLMDVPPYTPIQKWWHGQPLAPIIPVGH